MKRKFSIGLGIVAAAVAIPLFGNTPVLASLQAASESIVQNIFQPKVTLGLEASQKVVSVNAGGQSVTTWEPLADGVAVQPGATLRYTLLTENGGDRPVNNLVLTQPVPQQTQYIIGSARENGATLTFSIDGGETFVASPTVAVTLPDGTVEQQPAPANAYTHIQWDYSESLQALSSVRAIYEVAVN